MYLRQMINRVQNFVDDKVYWNDTRLKELFNHYKDLLSQEIRITTHQYYEFESVDGQASYQVPSTYVANEFLYYNSSYNQEIKIYNSPKEVVKPNPDTTTEGYPTQGYIWGTSGRRELFIYPRFNTDGIDIKWWFWGWPPDMDGDNDEPAFPLEWHPSLIEGVRADIQSYDNEISKGDALIIWQKEIRKIRGLDVTRELVERTAQIGSVEGQFPRISTSDSNYSSEVGFRVADRGWTY